MVTPEQIEKAVGLANSLRKATGVELIDDLPVGVPGNANDCILARAFNCGLSVCDAEADEYNLDEWCPQELQDKHDTDWILYGWIPRSKFVLFKRWVAQMGLLMVPEVWLHHRWHGDRSDGHEALRISVYLPTDVGEIADRFDNGQMDKKYYEMSPEQANELVVEKLRERERHSTDAGANQDT